MLPKRQKTDDIAFPVWVVRHGRQNRGAEDEIGILGLKIRKRQARRIVRQNIENSRDVDHTVGETIPGGTISQDPMEVGQT